MPIRDADAMPEGASLANATQRIEGRVSGVEPAGPGGVEFDPPNCQEVTKDGAPCSARRSRGTMFCIGHLRKRGEA